MNLSKLEIGKTFKNYKELCVELDMEIKNSTNSKNAQLKELARYCDFSKIGHKIKIEKIHDFPKEKVDNRGGSHNSIYGDIVQLLITDLLAQCDGHVSISRSKLMVSIGMVNINYGECRENVPKLSKYAEVDEKVIYDFYNTSTSSFRGIIETALNNLMDKRVIMYNKIVKVSEKSRYGTRSATEDELELIMNIEKEVLEEFGYKQISSVRVSKNWNKFKRKTKKMLHEHSNIDFYYTAYDITINHKYIIGERNELLNLLLEKVRRQESKNELNRLIYTNVVENAQSRHESSKEFTYNKKTKKTRSDQNYVDNMKQLADLLIDMDCPSILHKIREIESDIWNTDLNTFIDTEFERLFG